MSVRASITSPASCSGAAYPAVPEGRDVPQAARVAGRADAEVENLQQAVRALDHVARLQITVEDARFVGRGQRGRDLPRMGARSALTSGALPR